MQSKCSDEVFERNIQMGERGEDIVYDYLIKHNSYVEDLRKQKRSVGGGPRLRGTAGSVILPDFVVYNADPRKGNFAVDAKVKSSLYRLNRIQCFTVDDKFKQYQQAVKIKKLDFLMLAFIFNKRMYFYKDTDVAITTTFNNEFGSGPVYGFEYDTGRITY